MLISTSNTTPAISAETIQAMISGDMEDLPAPACFCSPVVFLTGMT